MACGSCGGSKKPQAKKYTPKKTGISGYSGSGSAPSARTLWGAPKVRFGSRSGR